MAGYRALFRESVWKDLRPMLQQDLKRILDRITTLAQKLRPAGSEKLSGDNRDRIRQGKYRIVYSIQDDELTIWIVKVGHRKNVYR